MNRKTHLHPDPESSNLRTMQVRAIHPETRVLDEKKGTVEYIASDETIDSYREVIRAKGWRFDHFRKNAPFVDSHDYSTIDKLLGRVVDFRIRGGKLVETVQWAVEAAEENPLIRIGWKMTLAGYLKAVSVGFFPVRWLGKHNAPRADWLQQLKELGLEEDQAPSVIYLEQQQIELSACIIGANPNALAKAYKSEAISDEDLDTLSQTIERHHQALAASAPGRAARAALDRDRAAWLRDFHTITNP